MAEAAAGMSGSSGYREKLARMLKTVKKEKPPTVNGWGFVFGGGWLTSSIPSLSLE